MKNETGKDSMFQYAIWQMNQWLTIYANKNINLSFHKRSHVSVIPTMSQFELSAWVERLLKSFTDIAERNNEEDDDNLEDLEHADKEMVESEYIVKPGYLQVFRSIFGDGSDDDGYHVAETVRDADEQSEKIPTSNHRHRTASIQRNAKRENKLLIKI
ncbi:hypothetical protein JTB14_016752 [Gonioctena quinquepunctata]|nr:hypothetical protein JTB14_016752 [Gonioctena quinquepunctata]